MKALEFKAKIKNNRILLPARLQSAVKLNNDKDVRVIVLMDEEESSDEALYQIQSSEHFLNGYAVSDSIYDNYK